jgi:hypothetical protein
MLLLRQGKLYNDELHNSCSLRNVIRIDKKRRVKMVGHVERLGEILCLY